MIKNTFEDFPPPEWVKINIKNPINELVIIRDIIPWQRIIDRSVPYVFSENVSVRKVWQ